MQIVAKVNLVHAGKLHPVQTMVAKCVQGCSVEPVAPPASTTAARYLEFMHCDRKETFQS
jgi:hypothetical protein